MTFKRTQNLYRWPKNPSRTARVCGKWHHTKVTHTVADTPVRFLTVLQNHRAGPQVVHKWIANVYFVCRCSQVCLTSVSQVIRRLHAGVRRSCNRRQFSQVYLICIAGVSQVYLKCTATCSQPSRRWISVHAIEWAHGSQIWFRLESDQLVSEYHTWMLEIFRTWIPSLPSGDIKNGFGQLMPNT